MSYPHILAEIVNQPLLVTPAKLEAILSLLFRGDGRQLTPDLSALARMNSVSGNEVAAEIRPVNQVESDDETVIEVVPVLGSLVARNHGWDGDGSGLRSYRTLMMDLNGAARNPAVGGIILDLDTYGGMSAGCERASRLIAEVAAIKPVYAVVDLNAYSAGYWLAAACSKIILTDRTAGVGSIGCIAIHCDLSKANEQDGLNYTVVAFGARKDQFSPLRPLSKGERSELEKSVSAHGMRFAETVAELRGMTLEQVLATEAGAFSGREAIDLGLADEIASFDQAAAMLADEIATRKRSSFTATFSQQGEPMTTKERIAALLTAEDGPQALAELGYTPATDAQAAQATAIKAAAEQQHQQSLEVAEICQLGQMPLERAVAMLRENLTADQARETIQHLRAEASKKTVITSTTTSFTAEGKHPLIAACEAMRG